MIFENPVYIDSRKKKKPWKPPYRKPFETEVTDEQILKAAAERAERWQAKLAGKPIPKYKPPGRIGLKPKDNTMKAKRALIIEAKLKPCTDCGEEYPSYVMDLDHVDPKLKRFNFNDVSKLPVETLRAEISKCEPVCANCHRERTYGPLKRRAQRKYYTG